MHRNIKLAGIVAALLLAGGCNDSTNYNFDQSISDAKADYATQASAENATSPKALFAPASGIIPSSTDLLFTGSTDGTLNIPVQESMSDGQKALIAQLNTLDGFSTTNPVTTTFSAPLDEATVKLGQTVFVFELPSDPADDPVLLTSPDKMVVTMADANKTKMALVPTSPLKPATRYYVVLTNGIQAVGGTPIKADTTYQLVKGDVPLSGDFEKLEPLRKATNDLEDLAAGITGINKDNIVLSWTFNTQSMGKSLAALAEANLDSTIAAKATGLDTKKVLDPTGANPAISGAADIYAGTIKLPYYLNKPANTNDPAILQGSWQIDKTTGLPTKTTDVTVPVLITVPNTASGQTQPADGWPVVIFQHGVTTNRTLLLGIAETLAKAGFVGIAIDMPLHGLASGPLYSPGNERTFDIDLANNETGEKAPDEKADASGDYFINPQSLLTSRDNLRQAVADLMVLKESIDSLDPVIPVDESNIRFIGHSLGGMVGTIFLAFEDEVGAATLAMPGGGIANVLVASPTFGPIINKGLAENGLTPGTEAYASFVGATQWIIDAADPINHGKAAAEKHAIHMLEVVGGAGALPDQVIPNNVPGAPLSGTDPLARVMGLVNTKTSAADAAGLHVLVKFNAGGHGSIVRPDPLEAPVVAVTVEMQTQTAAFMATNGTALPITDATVIAE